MDNKETSLPVAVEHGADPTGVEPTEVAIEPTEPTGIEPTETIVAPTEGATVAHADADSVVTLSDTELQTHTTATAEPPAADTQNLVATADSAGHAKVMIPTEGNAQYVTRDELKELLHQAYMQGRNEAVEQQILTATTLPTATPPDTSMMSTDVAQLFKMRPSVWE